MGLRNRESAPAAAPTTPAPASASLPAAAPVPAPSATGAHPAALTLPELRAKLAGGLTGGTNPPEASLPAVLIEPTTRETPDGGAEPIPTTIAPLPSTPAVEESKRKRRTKAEMEAARAAVGETSSPQVSTPLPEQPTAPSPAPGAPLRSSVSGDVSELQSCTDAQLAAALRSRLPEGTSLTLHARMV